MEDAKYIRQWARENGIAAPARGRLPRRVLQAYAFAKNQNPQKVNEEVAIRFELLARHLEPRFGNIYEGPDAFDEGQAWTPELKQAVREYLLDRLPADVWAAMFDAPMSQEACEARETEVDDWLGSSISPSGIALAVRDAAVKAQPSLDRIAGQTDDWPGGEDQKFDAEFWLEVHADERELRDMAAFLHEDHASLSTLIESHSPAQLVKA
jgi:hypothetical protein